jgi:excinuclease ABC subunit C
VISDFSKVPLSSGVYQFFDSKGIIYIGKAKSLRKRVRSYFTSSIKDRKTEQIKKSAIRVETFTTFSESEALILEQQLIKEYKPKFNILLRDDKTYPYIYFDSNHPYPSIALKRNKKAIDQNYYGPYINAKFTRQQLKDLQKIFLLRNCSDSTFSNRSRPCIEYQMKRCSAPCVGYISELDYSDEVHNAKRYLTSGKSQMRNIIAQKMNYHSDKLEFEKASEFKKKLTALTILEEESSISTLPVDLDIISLDFVDNFSSTALLNIRSGQVVGLKTFFFRENYNKNIDQLVQRICFDHYQQSTQSNDRLLVTHPLKEKSLLEGALLARFNKKVRIISSTPKHARPFVSLARLNAAQVIKNNTYEKNKYQKPFESLLKLFSIKRKNPTLECIDISHHSGAYAKGSIVHFNISGKEKKHYRTYNIPKNISGNDTASIKYVIKRRLSSNIPHPTFLLIDGGKSQLNAGINVASFNSSTTLISISKGANRKSFSETIFSKDGKLEIGPKDNLFKFLSLARDESHRFAIKANRASKLKSMQESILDTIKGIGPQRRSLLMSTFKNIKTLSLASIEEISSLKGISNDLAKTILKELDS